MNLWLAGFIVSWILFFGLADYKRLVPNIFVGIGALAIQVMVDSAAGSLGLYKVTDPLIKLSQSSFLFTYGPVLTMGTLFSQYYPKERHLKIINIFVWTSFFFLFETGVHMYNYLIYTNWRIFYSLSVDMIVLVTLSFICEIFVYPQGEIGETKA